MSTVGLVLASKTADASCDLVWSHIVDADLRQGWWSGSQIEAKLGGSVREHWSEGSGDSKVVRDATGVIDVCISGHVLGFRWRDAVDAHDTEVLLTLRSGDSGSASSTDITVTETGFGRFADASERIADAQQGWIDLLTALVAAVNAAELEARATQAENATEAAPVADFSEHSASDENMAPNEEISSESSSDAANSPDAEMAPAAVDEEAAEDDADANAAGADADAEAEAESEGQPSFDALLRGDVSGR